MTDRELLELAAKASGLVVRWHSHGHYGPTMEIMEDESGGPPWNPIADDGDALRLAVKLQLEIVPVDGRVDVCKPGTKPFVCACESGPNFCAATRRAIVRAAAELGKAMVERLKCGFC